MCIKILFYSNFVNSPQGRKLKTMFIFIGTAVKHFVSEPGFVTGPSIYGTLPSVKFVCILKMHGIYTASVSGFTQAGLSAAGRVFKWLVLAGKSSEQR